MSDKVKEYPIIFSAPMVKAILDDKKHMTRRLVKPQPQAKYLDGRWYADRYNHSSEWCFWGKPDTDVANLCGLPLFRCPYGKKGEWLWVREAALPDFPKEFDYYDWSWREVPGEYRKPEFVLYRASYSHPDKLRWHPSVFMPRWASRITLEIVGVKVERLQDISEEDAIAEGVAPPEHLGAWERAQHWEAREAFRALWESINGPESWERNDLVWAISFRRIP